MLTPFPSFMSPSKITLTSMAQSVPASTVPLTSVLDLSARVMPLFNKSSAFIFLKIDSKASSSDLLLAPLTSSFFALIGIILIPFEEIILTRSVK